mmetsp:Transcript_17867/g.30520  ORF Transcript_17867/g.30520 Transcript_17867/m.30520 type:complete len:113 (-) Transcript_17867:1868-2206(-)
MKMLMNAHRNATLQRLLRNSIFSSRLILDLELVLVPLVTESAVQRSAHQPDFDHRGATCATSMTVMQLVIRSNAFACLQKTSSVGLNPDNNYSHSTRSWSGQSGSMFLQGAG